MVVRKSVLVLLLNRQCTGELSNPSVAVFLQSRRARYGLLEDSVAFLRRDLAVFTAFSTFPLDRGKPGQLVTCSKPYCLGRSANAEELNGEYCPR